LRKPCVLWTLDPDLRATAPEHTKRQSRHESKLIECSQCCTLRVGGKPCPKCGFMPKRPAEFIATAAGELGLVKGGRAIVHYDQIEKDRWHGMLTYIVEERGYKPGWIAYKFKEKFGHWPTRRCVPPIALARSPQLGALAQHRVCQGEGGGPAAEPPRNSAGVPNLQQSDIIQPTGCNGRCLPLVNWECGLHCAYRAQSVSRSRRLP
jgi:hypothetical protein